MNPKKLAVAVALALGAISAQAAPPTNAGFESGLSGWTTSLSNGSAAAVASNTTNYSPGDWGTDHTFLPYAGSSFLAIAAGDAGVWQTVSQTVTLGSSEMVSGVARFDWGDYYTSAPDFFPDGAKVEILDASNNVIATPFYFDGAMACPSLCNPSEGQSGYETDWTPWSFSAESAGTYTIVYGARNTGDGGGPNQTYGYFDGEQAAPVPEPETYAMLLAGLGLLGFAARRRKQKLATA